MKFGEMTERIAIITLALYGVYALFVMGIGSVILASAIGLITAAFTDRMEVIAAAVVVVGMLVGAVVGRWRCREGFDNAEALPSPKKRSASEGFDSAVEIKDRVEKIARKQPVQGVYNNEIEGFANVDGKVGEGAPAESVAASSKRKDEVAPLPAAPLPAADGSGADKAKPAAPVDMKAAPAASTPAPVTADAKATQGFKSESSLFRLGEMPSEKKDGPFLDASSTLMRAISALQPDQVKSMTEETQKMIETQKNMMTMLQSMRPVLQDGRQLLDSFSGIFGGGKI